MREPQCANYGEAGKPFSLTDTEILRAIVAGNVTDLDPDGDRPFRTWWAAEILRSRGL
jgi:hypothetical protein